MTGGDSGLGFACASAILKSPHGASWHCPRLSRRRPRSGRRTCGAGVAGQGRPCRSTWPASRRSAPLQPSHQKTEHRDDGVQRRVRRPSHSPHAEQTITGAAVLVLVRASPPCGIDDRDDNRIEVETLLRSAWVIPDTGSGAARRSAPASSADQPAHGGLSRARPRRPRTAACAESIRAGSAGSSDGAGERARFLFKRIPLHQCCQWLRAQAANPRASSEASINYKSSFSFSSVQKHPGSRR